MNAFSSRFDATGRTSTGMAAAPYMPTTVDVFAKTRDHERAEILRAAREADIVPYWRPLSAPAGPVVDMEGAERVMLGSNNYLGLTGDDRVKQGARDALDRYGTGLTGSRFMNGTTDLHRERGQGAGGGEGDRSRDRLHHRSPGEFGLHGDDSRAGGHGDRRLRRSRVDPRRVHPVPGQAPRLPAHPP